MYVYELCMFLLSKKKEWIEICTLDFSKSLYFCGFQIFLGNIFPIIHNLAPNTVMNQFCFASSCTRSKKKQGRNRLDIYVCVGVCVCVCACAMDVPIASYSAIDVNPVAIAKLFNKHRAILCDLVMSAYFESNPKWGIRVTK